MQFTLYSKLFLAISLFLLASASVCEWLSSHCIYNFVYIFRLASSFIFCCCWVENGFYSSSLLLLLWMISVREKNIFFFNLNYVHFNKHVTLECFYSMCTDSIEFCFLFRQKFLTDFDFQHEIPSTCSLNFQSICFHQHAILNGRFLLLKKSICGEIDDELDLMTLEF